MYLKFYKVLRFIFELKGFFFFACSERISVCHRVAV